MACAKHHDKYSWDYRSVVFPNRLLWTSLSYQTQLQRGEWPRLSLPSPPWRKHSAFPWTPPRSLDDTILAFAPSPDLTGVSLSADLSRFGRADVRMGSTNYCNGKIASLFLKFLCHEQVPVNCVWKGPGSYGAPAFARRRFLLDSGIWIRTHV
ncbi:hypothetical protein BC628DRAFT_91620 [Trametes gibbosa]|nr:hypothetical protein BC628DRAFT_680993 [Trametes gibbosa]KAI0828126.1 hypothetical protein BC628DRAFT_91620 [Trametes gibbosa]